MPGLVPGIHVSRLQTFLHVDGRNKSEPLRGQRLKAHQASKKENVRDYAIVFGVRLNCSRRPKAVCRIFGVFETLI